MILNIIVSNSQHCLLIIAIRTSSYEFFSSDMQLGPIVFPETAISLVTTSLPSRNRAFGQRWPKRAEFGNKIDLRRLSQEVDIWRLPVATIITMSSKRKMRGKNHLGNHSFQSSLLSLGWFSIIGFIVNVSRLFAWSFVCVVNRTAFLCHDYTSQRQSNSVLQLFLFTLCSWALPPRV